MNNRNMLLFGVYIQVKYPIKEVFGTPDKYQEWLETYNNIIGATPARAIVAGKLGLVETALQYKIKPKYEVLDESSN